MFYVRSKMFQNCTIVIAIVYLSQTQKLWSSNSILHWAVTVQLQLINLTHPTPPPKKNTKKNKQNTLFYSKEFSLKIQERIQTQENFRKGKNTNKQ